MSRETRVNPFTTDSGSRRTSPPSNDDDRGRIAGVDAISAADDASMSDSYMEIARQIDTAPRAAAADDVRRQPEPRRPDSLVTDKTFPYNLDGIVSKDGDMTHFVTENLEYKIKLSSPVTRKDMGNFYLRHNSTPSSSPHSVLGGLSTSGGSRSQLADGALAAPSSQHAHLHQPHQHHSHQQHQIDLNVLNDIEIEAQYLAASLDNLTENLCNLLHSISSITADNVEIHKNAVNKLTDSMDANIKSMYTIMAKTEEISKSMKPTEQLATRIREIKRLVDMLESNV